MLRFDRCSTVYAPGPEDAEAPAKEGGTLHTGSAGPAQLGDVLLCTLPDLCEGTGLFALERGVVT